jgi:hypothetical protein
MPPSQIRLTSDVLWAAAIFAALIDAIFVYLLTRLVPPERFRRLFWPVGAVGAVFWGLMWTWAMWGWAWEPVYSHVFPAWSRYVVPWAYGLIFGAVALGFWALAVRCREPVVVFCVLGGLVSLPGHLIGAARGLFKVPMLQDVSIVSGLTFGIFEFAFYFAVILTVAAVVRAGWDRGARAGKSRTRAAGASR